VKTPTDQKAKHSTVDDRVTLLMKDLEVMQPMEDHWLSIENLLERNILEAQMDALSEYQEV